MKNEITFRVTGRNAMFTDPISRMGGEKYSYQIPTYEALKGIAKSIYWKPTIIWYIDSFRVINKIQTQAKGTKPRSWNGGNTLAIYTFLRDVEYEVKAHFEFNPHRPELLEDRIEGKHFAIANRMLEKGGRQDIFLGTRDCQAYVEPCKFGESDSNYRETDELSFGLMFHSYGYPDETGGNELIVRFNEVTMRNGEVCFVRPENCSHHRVLHEMLPKTFDLNKNLKGVEAEANQ